MGGINYFDTVSGHEFVEMLKSELPKLTRRRNQSAYIIGEPVTDKAVYTAIKEGDARFVGSYVDGKGKTVVILEEY